VINHRFDLPLRWESKGFKEGVGGREQIIRMAKPVGFIGYRALFAEEIHHATAVAIEDSLPALLRKKSFTSFFVRMQNFH